MKILSSWVHDFVAFDLHSVDQVACKLTDVGLAVEFQIPVKIAAQSQSVTTANAIADGVVFEMEIGTNRPDAMNHYGVAREVAAIYDLPLMPITPHLPSAAKAGSRDEAGGGAAGSRALSKQDGGRVAAVPFPITVEEPELCPRFTARVIRNTHILPSPEKVAHRLQLLDQRPIWNAVDATNYVLWGIGKPTHVYDMDLLEGGRIVVRMARAGETLKTLDGVERKLTAEDLVVCDAKKPVGLAGVMGGFDTMITEKTQNIVIESAWWDPLTVRKMSRRHGLHTDASHRFERGADFESTIVSCDLVAQMILESGGGEAVGDVVDIVSKKMDQAPVLLHVSEVHRILGGGLDAGQIFRLLKRLGFTLIPEGQGDVQFWVHIPSWRLDVEREIDVIEEVARLHGYNKFPNTLPSYSGAVVERPHAAMDAAFRNRSLALGYNEAISLTFISHDDAERFETAWAEAGTLGAKAGSMGNSAPFQGASAGRTARVLELENPLSEEASVMRTSLIPGMLDMLAWNLNRDVPEARLFEMGSVYEVSEGERTEPRRACLGATVAAVRASLPVGSLLDVSKGEQAVVAEAFRGFKGDVENLLAEFSGSPSYDRQVPEYFHPGRSARALLDGAPVAEFGQIHPEVAAARKLRQDVFIAQFDLEQLYRFGLRKVQFTALPKYPAVERDFSFVFADTVSFEQMRGAVDAIGIRELVEFSPVEIFRGGSIGTGKYSILLRARFQSAERTLREEEVAQWSGKIVTALTTLGGIQRV